MGKKSKKQKKSKPRPGVKLELAVARIQTMLDPNSVVIHDETLIDRAGNSRQYDIVIRGHFGGKPILGVIECKDHNRKKGPDSVEAFAKKTENLRANLRMMVSKKGFTHQALRLAKHEGIGCLSLLPSDPKLAGFSVGDHWYGWIRSWVNFTLSIYCDGDVEISSGFDSTSVKYQGKCVFDWFVREFLTKHGDRQEAGDMTLSVHFDVPRELEIAGTSYLVNGLSCKATRVVIKKRKWVTWSGDALYDWHASTLSIPAQGELVGSGVETDLTKWDDYDGEIPIIGQGETAKGFLTAVMHIDQRWDEAKCVVDLSIL